MRWIPLIVSLFAGLPSGYAADAPGQTPMVMRHVAMATDLEFIVYRATDVDVDHVFEVGRNAFAAVDALEQRITRWQPDSETWLINRRAHDAPVSVGGDLLEMLLRSRHFYETTSGVFDVTVGPLLSLWGFYGESGALPPPDSVKQVLEQVGLNHVTLDKDARTVFFEKPGISVDFGGIAKGLALDRAASVLAEDGISAARLSIGTSTIVALGAPPNKAGWTVDIRSPYNSEVDASVATVTIRDEALSSSSGTERFIEMDGKRYSHIFDPRTGMPASAGVVSATAIAPTGVESDALSTAFYVMGVEKTRAYCQQHPHVRAIVVVEKDDGPETVYINFSNDTIKEQL